MRFIQNPLLVALLAFILFLSGLGAVGFVGPDEARYADVARGMLLSGDYVTPRLFGEPWFEKPPLYYWIASQLFRIGTNEQTARLPSVIAAIIFLLIWYRFAKARFGETVAVLATIFLASSLGWIGFARAAAMDMLFTVTLDLALLLLALWLWERKPLRLYGFYLFLALATLAKGPLAVVLAGLVFLGYVATFRDWSALRPLLFSPALAVFFAVAGPWYALCYAANGAPFVEEFILEHNLARFVSPGALGHGQPVWFYIPVLVGGLFPWSPLLLLPLGVMVHAARGVLRDKQGAFLFWWVVLPFAFFSLSENKLPGYLLPVLPPLTLWIAILVGQAERTSSAENSEPLLPGRAGAVQDSASCRRPPEVPLILIGCSALLLLTVPLLAPLLSESLATGLRQALAEWNLANAWRQVIQGTVPVSRWLLLAGSVGFTLYFATRKQPLYASFMAFTGVAVCLLAIMAYLSPAINRVASTRPVAERVIELGVPAEEVAVYRIHRNQTYQLSFYLGHGLAEWSPEDATSNISIIVANQDEQIPIARPLSYFPGQRLRIWELIGLRIETVR
jgi:4-amino-4-deoxy-L-arabinose transferase-like glycosyltransferase